MKNFKLFPTHILLKALQDKAKKDSLPIPINLTCSKCQKKIEDVLSVYDVSSANTCCFECAESKLRKK